MEMDRERGSHVSRRTMLAGLGATLPAVTIAGPSALAATEPDAELVRAIARYHEASEAYTAADMALNEASDRYEDPAYPEALYVQRRDYLLYLSRHIVHDRGEGPPHYGPDDVQRLRETKQTIQVPRAPTAEEIRSGLVEEGMGIAERRPWPEAQARADEIVAAWDWWQAEVERRAEAAGIPQAEKAEREAREAYRAAEQAIVALPVTTLSGLILKAQVVGEYYGDDLAERLAEIEESITGSTTPAEQVMLAIVRDLFRLGASPAGS